MSGGARKDRYMKKIVLLMILVALMALGASALAETILYTGTVS